MASETQQLYSLNDSQFKTLESFKVLLIEEGLYTLPTTNSPASHDDGTLLYVGHGVLYYYCLTKKIN